MTTLSYEQRLKCARARLAEIRKVYGAGYASDPLVSQEQVALSIELEVCGRMLAKAADADHSGGNEKERRTRDDRPRQDMC